MPLLSSGAALDKSDVLVLMAKPWEPEHHLFSRQRVTNVGMRFRQRISFEVPKTVGLSLFWVCAVVAALGYAWGMSAWGPWTFSDSAVYVDVARNLNQGLGLYAHTAEGSLEFLAHYPPGYPAVLSLGLWLTHGDWLAAGRWVNLISLVIFLAVAGGLVYEATQVWSAGLLSMVALAAFFPVLRIYLGLMSEGMFLALEMISLYLLWRYVSLGEKRRLWIAALVAGVSVLVRYAGATFGLVFALAPLMFSAEASLWRRMKEAIGGALLVALPFGLWTAYVVWFGQIPPRQLNLPAQWLAQARAFVHDTAYALADVVWPLKGDLPWIVIALVWAVLLAVVIWGVVRWRLRRWAWDDAETLTVVAWLVAVAWLPALALMRLLVVPPPALNVRMYTPAMAAAWLMVVAAIWGWWHRRWPEARLAREAGTLVIAVLVLLLFWKMPALPSRQFLREMHYYGGGYTAKPWHRSFEQGVLHAVDAFPADVLLFSNKWEVVLLWTGRPARYADLFAWARAEPSWTQGQPGEWRRLHGAFVWLADHEPEFLREKLLIMFDHRGGRLCAEDAVGRIYFPGEPLPAACRP